MFPSVYPSVFPSVFPVNQVLRDKSLQICHISHSSPRTSSQCTSPSSPVPRSLCRISALFSWPRYSRLHPSFSCIHAAVRSNHGKRAVVGFDRQCYPFDGVEHNHLRPHRAKSTRCLLLAARSPRAAAGTHDLH